MQPKCFLKLLAFALGFALLNAISPVEIFVQNGKLIGEKYTVLDRSVVRFLGVPFAKPPLGSLRFRRPLPVDKWSEPVKALEWPNSCVQKLGRLNRYVNQNMSMGEDCLKLNVWTPGVNADEHSLRPVLVWILGERYHYGSSSFDLYNGEALSVLSSSVVVTFNYRVSTLGFFYSDKVADVKGNQGLYDQRAAIKFIHENIRYFGGNPKAITLLGERAGAWSVSLHILSPLTRDLFANAIIMNGAALIKSVTTAEKITPRLLGSIRKVGCAAENDTSIGEEVVQCLEKLDPHQVDSIAHLMEGDTLDFHELAVVDGEFLPSSPIEMLTTGNHKKNFNLLISTVEDEASFFLQFSDLNAAFRKNNPEPITLEESKNYLLSILTSHIVKSSVPNETISRIYFNGLNGNFDPADLFRRQVSIAYGDVLTTCPTLEFAKALYRSSPETIKVFQFYYTANLGNDKGVDVVNPIFGMPFRDRKMYHNREREISIEIINFLRAFVLTGNPGEDQSEWQSYFLGDDGQLVAPYYEIGNSIKRHTSFKFNLKELECGRIWNKYIYEWDKN